MVLKKLVVRHNLVNVKINVSFIPINVMFMGFLFIDELITDISVLYIIYYKKNINIMYQS